MPRSYQLSYPDLFFINSTFLFRDHPFICASLFNASLLVLYFSENKTLTGLCEAVYLPPPPVQCCLNLRSRSFVHPVYKLLSSHSIIYVNHSCIMNALRQAQGTSTRQIFILFNNKYSTNTSACTERAKRVEVLGRPELHGGLQLMRLPRYYSSTARCILITLTQKNATIKT